MTRHFLRDDDITPAEQQEILDLAEPSRLIDGASGPWLDRRPSP
jgi:ornithine carbamoyltransferase